MIGYAAAIVGVFILLLWIVTIDPERSDRKELIVADVILIVALAYSLFILYRPEAPGPINYLETLFKQIPILRDIVI